MKNWLKLKVAAKHRMVCYIILKWNHIKNIEYYNNAYYNNIYM